MIEVIFFSLVGGVFSLIGGALLISKKSTARGLAEYATPFAAGVLLAAAFVDLLPEALHNADSERAVMMAALFGVLAFFILERFLGWFHHHHDEQDKQKAKVSNSLIIIGDTLHNALDGVAIGAAFLVSVPTGIVAAIAVAVHEIPQEIGDMGLMLNNGMKRSRVLIVNAISALATTVTAVTIFAIGGGEDFPVSIFLAITAGFFIYIATSDIIPEIHDKSGNDKTNIRPLLLLIGAILVMIVSPIAHDYIDSHEHSYEQENHAVVEGHDDHSEHDHKD